MRSFFRVGCSGGDTPVFMLYFQVRGLHVYMITQSSSSNSHCRWYTGYAQGGMLCNVGHNNRRLAYPSPYTAYGASAQEKVRHLITSAKPVCQTFKQMVYGAGITSNVIPSVPHERVAS
jgi:hypothetical protein